MPSFSVRCFFLWARRPDQTAKYLYEERITLWQATDVDEALKLAEDEAGMYAAEDDKYLEFAQAYALYEDVGTEETQGTEIFSLLRESDLEPDDYLSAFFDTGKERTR